MILQTTLPYDIHAPRPLPGIAPLDEADWIRVDEAFGAQMAERERLIAERRDAVIALDPSAAAMARELLDTVLAALDARADFEIAGDVVTRPDGGKVRVVREDPMATIGRLCQEDFCLMDKRGDEHVLVGAVLCFPAGWTLSEKFMRPLTRIHVPVDPYDENIAKRVQRLFDGVRVGRPLWRFNALVYTDPSLHQPRPEGDRREKLGDDFLRSELQTVRRLPESGAVVFGIHTYVLDWRGKAAVPEA
ncbi:heme-dependent oxidative N-demethylase family protein [Rhodalgimonas zhirmunskyi]|uniref:DUF3445 domain-containing protein n=1 Tax=Rhodalgimonas zhirmunskyi TaxID=2964767 RepID=A0AAJ1U903_9RHOB|nr:DUF3445 domain-containing protein [Rhodoalgimonas zhirmunskyi]MDQ2095174.1 DUF3445 domain-containing protein [Rhodoalgimonas zhirmunskyi]